MLAEQLSSWLAKAGEAWPFGNGVVSWSLPFNADAQRAWNECPRADYLLVLAALGGANHTTLHRVVCATTRELIALCPGQTDLLTAMQTVSESFMRHEPLPAELDLGQEAAANALRDAETRARAEFDAVRSTITPHLEAIVAASASAGGGGGDEPSADRLRAALEAPELLLLRAMHDGHIQRACATHAMCAHFAALVVAKLAESTNAHGALLREYERAEPELRATLDPVRARFEEHETKLYGSVAEVLRQSALAHAYAQAAGEPTWRRCLGTLAHAATTGRAQDDAFDVLANAVVREVDDCAGALMAVYADAIRSAVPISTLALGARVSETALRPTTMTEARASLRRGLAGTLEAAGSLGGDAELIKAIEIALSVLDAPGPLNRTTLAPVMSTVHEGLAALFRSQAETASPRERHEWLGFAADVDRDKRMFAAWLERQGGHAAN